MNKRTNNRIGHNYRWTCGTYRIAIIANINVCLYSCRSSRIVVLVYTITANSNFILIVVRNGYFDRLLVFIDEAKQKCAFGSGTSFAGGSASLDHDAASVCSLASEPYSQV